MARGSKLAIELRARDVPLLTQAATLAQEGFVTGASHRNWSSYGASVRLPEGCPDWRRHLLTDPQTSGGLLVACAPARAADIVQSIRASRLPRRPDRRPRHRRRRFCHRAGLNHAVT